MKTNANWPLLLASASPRRRELFHHLGYPFRTTHADVDETPLEGESAEDTVRRLALAKARVAHSAHPEAVVVGADTVVEVDGRILGKPQDKADARRMLEQIAGRDHCVWTGVAVVAPGGLQLVESPSTRVRFRAVSADEIDAYIASGEPMDKAGAYGIQERGAVFVESVKGDYFTVVGLPLCLLSRLLAGILGPPPTPAST
ncbi:MAG: Maf family protein [Nitrospirota bacterium]|nr:Maf family protein [Nitrospirota bacterium]